MAVRSKETSYVYGLEALREALAEGQSVDKVWYDQGLPGPELQNVRDFIKLHELPSQAVPEIKLRKLKGNPHHKGVAAFLSLVDYYPLDQVVEQVFEAGELPLLVMLDGVTDVRNLGAIARSAECFGAHALVLPVQGSAPINHDALHTSAGALQHLKVCRVQTAALGAKWLQALGVSIVAATEKADTHLPALDAKQALCLVMGDENKGLSTQLLKQAQHQVRIPLVGKTMSLNVSVAAAICLYSIYQGRQA